MIDSIITIVLDKSLSMRKILEPTIDGFNDFISEQQEIGCGDLANLVTFSENVYVDQKGVSIEDVPKLTTANYRPLTSTSLYDGIGKAIEITDKQTRQEENSLAQVFVAILTDGVENTSKHYTKNDIKMLIKDRIEIEGWEFLFLGANQDAVRTGFGMGIPKDRALTYAGNESGMKAGFKSMSEAIKRGRLLTGPSTFTIEDKKAQQRLLQG